jgi:hypothetical protein
MPERKSMSTVQPDLSGRHFLTMTDYSAEEIRYLIDLSAELKAAKRDGTKTMGKKAGTEFVDSIFGRDRYLESSEKIMNQIRLWNMRFDVNCEESLRRPSAA